MERNLVRLPPMARLVPNDFRNDRLYTEEVDLLLKKHQVGAGECVCMCLLTYTRLRAYMQGSSTPRCSTLVTHTQQQPTCCSNHQKQNLKTTNPKVVLKALYSRYRLKPVGGGLRPKVVKLDGWLALMGDARLVDAQFTLSDAALAFLWSRMHVIDEIKDYPRWVAGPT